MSLIAAGAGWFAGAAGVGLAGLPWWSVGIALLLVTPLASTRSPRAGALFIAAGLAASAGAYLYAGWLARPLPGLVAYRGAAVTMEGIVDSPPDPGELSVRYVVRATSLGSGAPIDGKVIAYLPQDVRLRYGEVVRLRGEIEVPEARGDFDYAQFLLERGVVGVLYRPRLERTGERAGPWWRLRLSDLRDGVTSALNRSLPEPEASLAAGVLLGRDEGMPEEVQERFRDAGLAHLVAVSGSNIAIVAGATFLLASPVLGRRLAVPFAVLTIAAYTLLVFEEPSAVRAAIMASIFLVGLLLGRPQAGVPALAAAAIGMSAWEPALFEDVGFQLSCAATAGLLTLYPWLDAGAARAVRALGLAWAVPRPLRQVASLTAAATLATLPIVWATFGRISLVGPVANVLAEPLFPVAFAAAALTAVASLVGGVIHLAVAAAAYYPLHLIVEVGTLLGGRPWAATEVPVGISPAVVAAGLTVAAIMAATVGRRPPPEPGSRPRAPRAARALLAGAALGALTTYVAHTSLAPIGGPGVLRIDLLDVGQGDAILLTTPHGRQVLVDTGPSGLRVTAELGEVLPHWDRSIDLLVVTHPQLDHEGGLTELRERLRVRTIAYPAWTGSRLEHAAPLAAGDTFELDGVRFRVLWPPAGLSPAEPNDGSLVLLVEYGRRSILLTGDIEASVQGEVARASGPVDVLKVPHHGSRTSAPAFFAAVRPAVALVSVGEGNPYGHPASATLEALARAGSAVFRTDRDGRVTVTVSAERVRVSTER